MVRSLWAASCRVRYQSTVVAMASGSEVPESPKHCCVLGGVEHEGLVELVGHLDHGPQYWVEDAESMEDQLGHRSAVDRVPDLMSDELEDPAEW